MRGLVQCPNCLTRRVIILKKLHYAIFMVISMAVAVYCICYILTQGQSGITDMVTVGGAMLFTITSIIFTVKVLGPKKADVLCIRCGFRFKSSKY
jgi:hypothetical protein